MEPVVILFGVLPLLVMAVVAFVIFFKEHITALPLAAQMQKLTMANNLDRALKFARVEKSPFGNALTHVYEKAKYTHELDLLHEEGVVILYKYDRILLLAWLGLLLATINPALALIGAYNVAEGGPFVAGFIMSLVASGGCLFFIKTHNHTVASGKEYLRNLVNILLQRKSDSQRRSSFSAYNDDDQHKKEPLLPHLQLKELSDAEARDLFNAVDELDDAETMPKRKKEKKAKEQASKPKPEPELPPLPEGVDVPTVLDEL